MGPLYCCALRNAFEARILFYLKALELKKKIENSETGIAATWLLGSAVFLQFFSLLRAFLLPFFLIPSHLGSWSLMVLIVGYSANAHLGLLNDLSFKLPILRQQKATLSANTYIRSIFWYTLACGLLCSLILLMLSLFFAEPSRQALQLVSVIVLLNLLFTFCGILCRADENFRFLSFFQALHSLCSCVFVILGGYTFVNPLVGALVGLALSYIPSLLMFFLRSEYCLIGSVSRQLAWSGFRYGLPLLGLGLVDLLLMSADRWLISAKMSSSALGLFSFAMLATSFISMVPGSIAISVFPKMVKSHSADNSGEALANILYARTNAISPLLIVLVVIVDSLAPIVIAHLLPKYVAAIPVLHISVLSSFFLGLAPVANQVLTTLGHKRTVLVVQVVSIIASLLLSFFLIRQNFGILGVALGSFMGSIIYGLGQLYFASLKVSGKLQIGFQTVIRQCFIFFPVALVLFLFRQDFFLKILNITRESAAPLVKIIVSLLLLFFVFYFLPKESLKRESKK